MGGKAEKDGVKREHPSTFTQCPRTLSWNFVVWRAEQREKYWDKNNTTHKWDRIEFMKGVITFWGVDFILKISLLILINKIGTQFWFIIILLIGMTKGQRQALNLKHYKITIGIKIYKVFICDLKYAKIMRKKKTPAIPTYSSSQ